MRYVCHNEYQHIVDNDPSLPIHEMSMGMNPETAKEDKLGLQPCLTTDWQKITDIFHFLSPRKVFSFSIIKGVKGRNEI